MFDPATPRGFYFNRGVFFFGRMVENEMAQAEARSRKNAQGEAGIRLGNAARLGVLEKHLGIPIKRYRDPGNVGSENPFKKTDEQHQEGTTIVAREGG
jgi:hypothetical protein